MDHYLAIQQSRIQAKKHEVRQVGRRIPWSLKPAIHGGDFPAILSVPTMT